jgi:myo-inositol-1(or 4)-monophosphatase
MQCNDIRRFGAAAPELCYLAMGRCELYFEYLLSPWDFAAASLILQEAGGVCCSREGTPLDLTSPSGVLAANNPENLQRLTSIVKGFV